MSGSAAESGNVESSARRSVLAFSGAAIAVGIVFAALEWVVGAGMAEQRGWWLAPAWARGAVDALWLFVFVALAGAASASGVALPRVMVGTLWAVGGAGVLDVVRRSLGADFGGLGASVSFLAVHTLAVVMLGWKPREALITGGVWVFAGSVGLALGTAPAVGSEWAMALSVLAAAPGVLLAWVRAARSADRETASFFESRYEEVHRDLLDARRIHEAAFPEPIRDGSVQFTYQYLPMSQIGGDYLHAFRGRGGHGSEAALSIALLDVTGHGIAAALTVNRLHGELTRLYAEHPDMRPVDVLRALNKYVYLTLADYSVFVTGFIMRADPGDNTLEYASAGHPPGFLRSSTGILSELDSTAMVLGALPDEDYQIDEAVRRFGPGDCLIAYTDGVIEAREPGGEFYGMDRLRDVFKSGWADTDGRWPAAIVRSVERFRKGEADDDTLVVELFRTMGGATVGSSDA